MSVITNKSDLNYNYKIDPTGTNLSKDVSSNVASVNLITAGLGMIKAVDKAYATIGDVLNYTVTLNNTGNILLTNINFKDAVATGASFVTGSVKVDNVSQPTYDIVTGFDVGSMIIAGTKTITFQLRIDSLPSPNTIKNKATTTYNYLVTSLIDGSSQSNEVTTTINVTNMTVVKSSNVTDVKAGDEIIYTVVITNTGNVTATNVVFTDILVSNLTFVPDSVTVNGTAKTGVNPNTGFALDDINPSSVVTVVFKATVNS